MKVYLAWYSRGEYEDYLEILVGVYANRELAKLKLQETLYDKYVRYNFNDESFEEWCENNIHNTWVVEEEVKNEM